MNTYKGNHKNGEIELVEEVEVFRNRYATLFNDKVKFPGGSQGQYLRFCWNAPYGVMVIATSSDKKLLLIHNFRHESRTWQWEIPKGFGEPQLSPMECAMKELKEETGFEGSNWKLLHTLNMSGCPTHVFTADINETNQPGSNPESSEAIAQARFLALEQCNTLVADAQVHDPMTLYAISRLATS